MRNTVANWEKRCVYFTHPKTVLALECYLTHRISRGLGTELSAERYRGLAPQSCLVLAGKGRKFAMNAHTVIGTAANVHDVNAAQTLLHGHETNVYANAGYHGVEKRGKANSVGWHVAMKPGKRRQLNLNDRLDAIYDDIERLKAAIRARVEHPFRVLKRQSGYTKTRYRGLMKNTAQITTLFVLGNLWMARKAFRKT